jgi:SAM-dependent methyltransferase
MDTHSYSAATFQAKEDFVRQALASARPRRVLDVGANTGHFSALAAAGGAAVVAIDTDARCAGAIWEKARAQSLDVLPLVVNLARPTPPLGWRNRECAAFLDRARGSFDCVLMLAVLHHLLVTERVPLAEVLELAAELTTDHLVIEWVGPEDAMFRQIARGRDHLHADLNHARFEQACQRHFEVARSVRLGESHRWLYWLRKRAPEPGDSA